MTITGAIVLFAVIWFMALLIALPLGLRTHGDEGTNDDETPASSPVNPRVRRKMFLVTIITVVLWVPLTALIMSGWISVDDIDIWRSIRPVDTYFPSTSGSDI
jgi:predicted secreted protein